MCLIGTSTANTTNTPFGAAKPFGQPTLFGPTAPAATGNTFGTPTQSFGAGFGATPATSQPSTLFGAQANPGGTLFGNLTSSAPSTGFGGFGTTTNTAAGMQFILYSIFILLHAVHHEHFSNIFKSYAFCINFAIFGTRNYCC